VSAPVNATSVFLRGSQNYIIAVGGAGSFGSPAAETGKKIIKCRQTGEDDHSPYQVRRIAEDLWG